MNINNAMEQIEEIHRHMIKTEVFRGYKAMPVFMAGLIAIATALFQSLRKVPLTDVEFVVQWLIIAISVAFIVAASIAVEYFIKGDNFEKRQVVRVFGQFAPALFIGFAATVILYVMRYRLPALGLLPGLWAVLFSMGIFAMRPFLPRFIGYVGLYYLIAGCVLFRLAGNHLSLQPWTMGITFGLGNIFAAWILYLDKGRGYND